METCWSCKKPIEEVVAVCPYCGKSIRYKCKKNADIELSTMTKKCGFMFYENGEYKTGTKVAEVVYVVLSVLLIVVSVI